MRIIIIRHAESEANVNKKIQISKPDHKIELSERGHKQARQLGLYLDKYFEKNSPTGRGGRVRMYVSPYLRTMHTAFRTLGESNKVNWDTNVRHGGSPIFVDANLMELNFGLFAGHDKDSIKDLPVLEVFNQNFEMFNDPKDGGGFLAHRPMGNSPSQVFVGCSLFIDRMMRAKEHDGIEDFVVITHGATAKCLTLALTGDDPLIYDRLAPPANATAWLVKTNPEIGKNEFYGTIYNPNVKSKKNPEGRIHLLDDPEEPIRHDLYDMHPEIKEQFSKFYKKYPPIKAAKSPGKSKPQPL